MDQTLIDELWIDHMINAPSIINLLAKMMLMTNGNDISLMSMDSSKYVYQYVRYPQSFRATLIQISNEGYEAFLNAHSSVNRLQLYLKQIPEHMQMIGKIVSKNISVQLASRLLERSIQSIENIGKKCIVLAKEGERSFTPIVNLIGEVLKISKDSGTIGNLTETDCDDHQPEIDDCYSSAEKSHQIIRKAFEEYSRTLQNLPMGFKKLAFPLGRTVMKLSNTIGQCHVGLNSDQSINSPNSTILDTQIGNFVETFESLIQTLSNNDQTELRSYKIVFNSYKNLLDILPKTDLSIATIDVIQRVIGLIDHRIEHNDAETIEQLKTIIGEFKQSVGVENLLVFNSSSSDVQWTETRLSQIEKQLNSYYDNRLIKMAKIRQSTRKFTRLSAEQAGLLGMVGILEEIHRLFVALQDNWRFSSRIVTNFGEKLQTFINLDHSSLDPEGFQIHQKLLLEFLQDPSSIHRESHILYTMSRTCYDISGKYLMPRLASLSTMLTSKTNDEREKLMNQLKKDMNDVQREVKTLINQRKSLFNKAIQKKRAQIN